MKKILLNTAKNLLFLGLLCSPLSSPANTATRVESWFNNMNYSTTTNPGVYEGQSARYATLGGVSTRAPITQPFQFVSVQTPKYSAGCGGIDFYAGGFSAIDANQFVDNLRAIGQNAQSLAFMLAIQIVSPQLSGVMNDIQTMANKYLNMNMDSCQAATKLVGGTLDYFGAKQSNCTIKRMSDFGEDYTTANYACTTGGNIKTTEDSGGDANKIDFVKGNLAWYVLMQDPFFQSDPEFAEVVMNITGTLIIADTDTADDGRSSMVLVEPSISDDIQKERFENIYTALLHGKQAADQLKIYRCVGGAAANINGCNHMSNDLQIVMPNWDGLYARVESLMQSILSKISTDAPLTDQERGLIASTSVPIYRYLSAASAYFPRSTDFPQISQEYTSLIAHDILIRSLSAIIQQVEQRSAVLPNGMAGAHTVQAYRADLDRVMVGLAKMRKDNEYTAEQLAAMQDRILQYEKALMPRLGSGLLTSALWGK